MTLPASGANEPALAELVAQLRAERDGLRRAMRNRAVIEQAKGILMVRLGIGPDQAFDELARMSQHTNIRLAEVAASLVGGVAPTPSGTEPAVHPGGTTPSGAGRSGAPGPTAGAVPAPAVVPADEASRLQAQHQLLTARIGAADSYAAVVAPVAEVAMGWPRPLTVVLATVEPDGALRMNAAAGVSPEVRSQWTRIPPQVDVPVTVAVRRGTPVWLPDPETVRRRFPLLSDVTARVAAGVALPLTIDGRAVGALELTWREPVALTDQRRRYLRALAELCARAAATLARRESAEQPAAVPGAGWIAPVFAALQNPAAVLSPVLRDGAVVDFAIEHLNPPAEAFADEHGIELDGSRLLAVLPDIGTRLLLPALRQALATGVASQHDDVYLPPSAAGRRVGYRCTFRIARLWDRILMTWRQTSDGDLLHDQMLAAERIARIGSFWWDVRTGEVRWSPYLHTVLGRSAARPPVDMAELFDYLDARAVTHAMRSSDPVTVTVPARGDRWLRLTAERIRDDEGTVTAVRGTVQDVTAERSAEARRLRVEEALASKRQQARVEEALADAFQQALLPTRGELPEAKGLALRAMCHVTPRSGRVPTSWYDAIPLDDDETLLAVGEVYGQTAESLVTAARICNAIRGYAVLDMSPADILSALDTMVTRLFPAERASVALVRFDRSRRTAWSACAGHSRPLRFRGQERGVYCGQAGPPIAAGGGSEYRQQAVTVAPGDIVLLHTDGLAARRRDGRRHTSAALLDAAGAVDLTDPEAVLAHLAADLGTPPDGDICVVTARVF